LSPADIADPDWRLPEDLEAGNSSAYLSRLGRAVTKLTEAQVEIDRLVSHTVPALFATMPRLQDQLDLPTADDLTFLRAFATLSKELSQGPLILAEHDVSIKQLQQQQLRRLRRSPMIFAVRIPEAASILL